MRLSGSPIAVVSCDLDPIDCHLAGYGVSDARRCDTIYRRAVPRLLELLADLSLRAVFFVVTRDAVAQRDLLRLIRSSGHELASHSLSHPQPFRSLDNAALKRETADSRSILADTIGEPIIGFRTPGWDVDRRVLRAIADAGYGYDASVFPSPALALGRLVAAWRGAGSGPVSAMASSFAWAPLHPHHIGDDGVALVEFPIAVTPRLRLPAYHTISHLIPPLVFDRILGATLRSAIPFSYELHAADLLDLERDGVDRRMAVHPGMQLPLERKLETLRRVFTRIAAARRVVTYRQALAEIDVPLPSLPSAVAVPAACRQ